MLLPAVGFSQGYRRVRSGLVELLSVTGAACRGYQSKLYEQLPPVAI